MKKKVVIVLIIILVVGFLIYRNYHNAKKNKKIESTQVKRGSLEEKLTISGQIKAEEDVILRFQTSDELTWIGVKEGDYVKKYQVIANLNTQAVKKKLDKQLNTFLKTRADFDQTKDDNKDKALTDAIKRTLDKSQLDLNNAVLDVEIQHLAVEFSRLITPIEGIVVAAAPRYAGVNIDSTAAQWQIINPKTVYFEALADQTEVAKLRENMNGQLILDVYPDSQIEGVVKNVAFIPKTDETGTVYGVKFTFTVDNDSYRYKIGMTGDLTLTTKVKNDVLYLPVKFIKSDGGRKYVNTRKGKIKTRTYVGVGFETDNLIEIASGLFEGDTVYD